MKALNETNTISTIPVLYKASRKCNEALKCDIFFNSAKIGMPELVCHKDQLFSTQPTGLPARTFMYVYLHPLPPHLTHPSPLDHKLAKLMSTPYGKCWTYVPKYVSVYVCVK